jgi:hypothetical protein
VFHLELRQFPHNACRFNLTEAEMWTVVEPWSRDEWIEEGERKWSPHQARLTVLEGPHLEIEDLSMGRGWRNAQRRSTDVTERVIAHALAPGGAPSPGARTSAEPAAQGAPAAAAANVVSREDPSPGSRENELRRQDLRTLLGPDPTALLQAWRLAAERRPELSPSESLALAERTLRSLDDTPS